MGVYQATEVSGGLLTKKSLRLVIYLDDILIAASSQSEARLAVKRVISLLDALGFVTSDEKSSEEPSQ